MSKNLSQVSQEFDCSGYLSHGLKWLVAKSSNDHDGVKTSSYGYIRDEYYNDSKHLEKEPVIHRQRRSLLQDDRSSVSYGENSALPCGESLSFCRGSGDVNFYSEECYYEGEYSSLIKWIDEEDTIFPSPSQFAGKREEIQQISMLADKDLYRDIYDDCSRNDNNDVHCSIYQDHGRKVSKCAVETTRYPGKEFYHENGSSHSRERSFTCEELAHEVATKVLETARTSIRGISPGGFQNFVEEQLVGFGESDEKQHCQNIIYRKSRLCRHFVKGFCLRGDSCDFLHDQSFFCTDEQKVFLGGLPRSLTPEALKTKLEEQGFRVLNKPKIIRGFTPQVCLSSVEEAEKLIAQRAISIDGHRVDVRPYQDRDQLRNGLPNLAKRSVFLGGLPEDTTGEMIVSDLQRLDISVVECAVIKDGYAPRVVLGSRKNAQMLVSLKRVMVNGTAVDVRPYVNFKKRY